jgi:DNA gyrase inhibitor GyrI
MRISFPSGSESVRLAGPVVDSSARVVRVRPRLSSARWMCAFRWLYASWLPRSGYVPDDHPRFEAWIGRPFAHGLTHLELHVHVPVRRA